MSSSDGSVIMDIGFYCQANIVCGSEVVMGVVVALCVSGGECLAAFVSRVVKCRLSVFKFLHPLPIWSGYTSALRSEFIERR